MPTGLKQLLFDGRRVENKGKLNVTCNDFNNFSVLFVKRWHRSEVTL